MSTLYLNSGRGFYRAAWGASTGPQNVEREMKKKKEEEKSVSAGAGEQV